LVELLADGHEALVVDNLSNGFQEALNRAKQLSNKDFDFIDCDIRDTASMDKAFAAFKPDAVLHFAGLKAVDESVEKPLAYYDNNVGGTLSLLQAMNAHGCQRIVFSSSATVYGTPHYLPLDEAHPLEPVNPYGQTKLMVETMLRDWAGDGRKACALRYFNPVGAHESGRMGEDPRGIPNNLMPYVAQVAIGRRDALNVFGNDYVTRDGTGERDYIHITDLALAHLASLRVMDDLADFEALNIGTGAGTTVKELVDSYAQAAGREIKCHYVGRRAGDVASTIACPKQAQAKLDWTARLNIDDASRASWHWQSQNPEGYGE
jgi:UDP-glucose 4-epimerase